MPSSRKAPKKSADAPKKKASPAKKPAAAKQTAEPAPVPTPDPSFVRKASAAERKAAMEALAEEAGLPTASNSAAGVEPQPLPPAVREASPAERKAAVEKIVEESGVAGVLAKAPWKRSSPAPAAPQEPPKPAEPAPRTAPRATMTKAPLTPESGRSPPKTVVLDTNALMMQFQFHVDIEREVKRILDGNYEIVVPQIVVDELTRLSKEGTAKEQAEARMAVELAHTFPIKESPGDGDTAILRLADRLNAIVVTNDKRLRARLRAKDIPNIYMRSRAFLTIEGHIPGL